MAAPTGRLRKNTARQPTCSVSTPPSTGPAAIDTEPPTVHRAIARARRRASSYASRISASEAGIRTAAAPPWTTRAAISAPRPGATAQASEARVNRVVPRT